MSFIGSGNWNPMSIAGQEITYGELSELNKAMRANADVFKGTVGVPAHGVNYTGGDAAGLGTTGDYAPFVTQSIDPYVESEAFHKAHLWAMNNVPRKGTGSVIHEDTMLENHGSLWGHGVMAEGGGGSLSVSRQRRQVVQVRFQYSKRQVSDVSTMVNMLSFREGPAVSKGALDIATMSATEQLLGTWEKNYWIGQTACCPNLFDGFYTQITGHQFTAGLPNFSGDARGRYEDLEGATITPEKLIAFAAAMFEGPYHSVIGKVVVHPSVYASLLAGAVPYGRHDQSSNAQQIVYGNAEDGLFIMGTAGQGKIPVESAAFMMGPERRVSIKEAEGEDPPVISAYTIEGPSGGGQITVGSNAASKFRATDAGTYWYRITAVGDGGISIPLNLPTDTVALTVAEGQAVSFNIPDTGVAATKIRSYVLERTLVGGEQGTETFVWEYPRNTDGAGGGTLIVDANLHRPGCAPVYFLPQNPDGRFYRYRQLMDTFRRPLANNVTAIPFLVMNMGTLQVRSDIKCGVLDNVAFAT